jgi:hypothetical protein
LIGCFLFVDAHAQVKISGNLFAGTDTYTLNADSSVNELRDPFLYRIGMNAQFQLGKYIKLPFSFNYSKRNTSIRYPLPPNKEYFKNLSSPNNGFGISPNYKWATLHLGSHRPQLSELTAGNVKIFGGGLELKPGIFRLSLHSGVLNYAASDPGTGNQYSVFRKNVHLAKIGVGEKAKTHFHINAAFFFDKTSSLDTSILTAFIPPGQNLVLSPDFRINFLKNFYLGGETALSVYTSDIYSKAISLEIPPVVSPLKNIMEINATTRNDFAAKAFVGYKAKQFSIEIKGDYVGDGFYTAGFPFLQEDVFELKAISNLQLLKNKIYINSVYGRRFDNVSNTKLFKTATNLLSVNANYIITKQINLGATYSNYGLENDAFQDTFRIKNYSENIVITPRYSWGKKQAKHQIIVIGQKSKFNDFRFIDNSVRSNNTIGTNLNYTLQIKKHVWSVSGGYLNNQGEDNYLHSYSGSIGFQTNLLENKLSLGLTALLQNTYAKFADQHRRSARLNLKYKITDKLNISAQGIFSIHNRPSKSNYSDFITRVNITQKF